MLIPWFGSWWTSFFAPFGKIRPTVALTLRVQPKSPPQSAGIATVENHYYRGISMDRTIAAYRAAEGSVKADFFCQKSLEQLRGNLNFKKDFSGSFSGHAYPETLFRAFIGDPPRVVKDINFTCPAIVNGSVNGGNYQCSVATSQPVDFNMLHFNNLSVTIHGDKRTTWVDSVDFGFAGGRGGPNAQIGADGVGYGSFWIRDANLGQWPLMGPLSQMLKSRWFAFATLRFHSADGNLLFGPSEVRVPYLNLWGDEHAAVATGSIDTQKLTLDFTVRLRTFAGSKQTFNVLAPLMQPIASVLEARLTGPVQKPQWNLRLSAPNL